MNEELERLIRLARFDYQRAATSGLASDIYSAAHSFALVVEHPSFGDEPIDTRYTFTRVAGLMFSGYAEKLHDGRPLVEALPYAQQAFALAPPECRGDALDTLVETFNGLYYLTEDVSWLRRIVDALAGAIPTAGPDAARRVKDRLSILEQIVTLTQDETDRIVAVQGACDLLERTGSADPDHKYAIEALAVLGIAGIEPRGHEQLLSRAADALWASLHDDGAPDVRGPAAGLLTVVLTGLVVKGGRDAVARDRDTVARANAAADEALRYPQTPIVTYAAATTRILRYDQTSDPADLDSGIDLLRDADREARQAGVAESLQADLLQALLRRAARRGETADWAEIDQQVRDLLARGDDLSPTLRSSVGFAHLRRYENDGSAGELAGARAAFEAVAGDASVPDWKRSEALNSLGTVFQYLYEESGELGFLRDGRSAYERALQAAVAASSVHEFEADSLANLAQLDLRELGLGTDSRSKRDVSLLDEAIELQRRALDTTATADKRGKQQMNLGLALLSAYQDRHDRDELDEAVEQLEAAVQAPSASDREVGDRLTNLGNALLLRYDLDKSIPDLQGAIDAYNRAIEVTGSESMRSVGAHFGLAQCLSRGTDRDDWATDEYRLACRLAGPLDPTLRLNVAREWASWSEWREAWNEAAEAYDHALGALQDLYDRQLVRADQELRLEQARDVARRAAIAHVRAHQSDGADLREAVIAIEQGRALWLADALGRRELDAAHIEQSGRVEVERLRKALRALDALRSAPSPDADREPLRQTVQEVRDATDAVRRLPGYEDVFKRGRWSDVEAVAHEQPLVYLIPGDPDGAALILDGDLRSLPLPGLALSTIASDLAEYMRFLGGGDGRSRSTLTDEWPDVLDRACAWAWDHVMEPVLRAIGEQPGMTLVPVDLLSLLPLHAAWTGDTSGRRYAVDQLSISYAPSAIALRHALTRAGAVNREVNALTVIVPTLDGPSPLKYAAEEMTAVEVLAPSSRVATPEANAERILGELVGRDVVHFACHAVARPSDPLKSALRVDDRDLRLEEILALEGIDARLVVLSACQTALPGLRLIDEGLGLSAAFLKAGASTVVSSLWEAWDDATLALMIGLYRALLRGLAPAHALREAQRFVRDLDLPAWVELTRELFGDGIEIDPTLARRPFESPDCWAAFIAVGA